MYIGSLDEKSPFVYTSVFFFFDETLMNQQDLQSIFLCKIFFKDKYLLKIKSSEKDNLETNLLVKEMHRLESHDNLDVDL